MVVSAAGRTYRGRSADMRAAARRDRLIDAGLELFGTIGYRDTTLAALARQSGVAERYFSESFASREELLVAVHDKVHAEAVAAVLTAVAQAGPSTDARVRAGLGALLTALTDDPRRARVKLIESVGAGPLIEARRRAALAEIAAFVASQAPTAHRDPRFSVPALALAVTGAATELVVAWHNGELALSRDSLVEHIVLIFSAVQRGLPHPSGQPDR